MSTLVFIAGASGFLGLKFTKSIIDYGGFQVKTISRSSDDPKKIEVVNQLKQWGVDVVDGDYGDIDSLKHALHGVSVVVSALAKGGIQEQLNLIIAAKEVGSVIRFIPSEFGIDCPDDLSGPLDDTQEILGEKMKVRQALIESKIPYTLIINGVFLEYLISPFGGIHLDTKTVMIIGDGNYSFSSLHTDDIARFLPAVIMDPNAINKKVYLTGETHTCNEIAQLLEECCNHEFTKQHISFEKFEEKIRSSVGMNKFGNIIVRHVYLGRGAFSQPINDPNNELYSDIHPITFKQYLQTLVNKN